MDTKQENSIERGDLFLLGKHRLLCGDATSLMDVQKLMDGKKAELLLCDPPYNIDYVPENRKAGGRKVMPLGGIMNDHDFDYKKWFAILETGIVKGGMYITNIPKNFCILYNWMRKYFKKEPRMLLWIKGNHVLSRSDYHLSYEIIMYCRTVEGVWNGGRDQKAEWYVKQRNVNEYLAPTQKPIRLCEKAILNNSNEGDIVLDMFAGSGSTLIAAAMNNRISYNLEIDPKYINVIIQRWEQWSKTKAVKIT